MPIVTPEPPLFCNFNLFTGLNDKQGQIFNVQNFYYYYFLQSTQCVSLDFRLILPITITIFLTIHFVGKSALC